MKTKLAITILFVSCYLGQPAISQVVYFGSSDCGQWMANSKSNPAMRTWLLGYMSGLSSGLSNPKNDPLSKVNSAQQIYLWMDNYCAKNPLKDVDQGGNELFFELTKK
jgi:hypothetical protein